MFVLIVGNVSRITSRMGFQGTYLTARDKGK